MSAPASNSSVDVFGELDKALGFDTATPLQDVATITDKEENGFQKILQTAHPNNIDTSKDKPAAEADELTDYPEFFEPFKSILEEPYILPDSDTTNYSERAIKEFGQNFGHINNRDAFFEETYVRNARQEFLETQPNYKPLLDLEEGKLDKAVVLRNNVMNTMKAEAERTFREFSDEDYQKVLSRLFKEDGTFSQEGESRYNELSRNYLGHLSSIRTQAEQHAKSELETYRTNNAALTTEAKELKIGGIPLGEELQGHVLNFIRSGKLDEWESQENLTPKEITNRTLLKALMADPKSQAALLSKFVKMSVHHGVNTVARRKF